MSSMLSQRWGFRQHSWRHPADGGFDPASFDVVPLPEATARRFVTRHHYAASFPAARYSYGLTTTDDRLAVDGTTVDGRALVGVAVLSVPMRAAVLTNVFPDLQPNVEMLELGRLVLTDTPANAESWFLSRVFERAAAERIRGIVSFSDPLPRTRTVLGPDGHDRTEQFMPGPYVLYQVSVLRSCLLYAAGDTVDLVGIETGGYRRRLERGRCAIVWTRCRARAGHPKYGGRRGGRGRLVHRSALPERKWSN